MCDFCRDRRIEAPCLKLRGPKSAERMISHNPSRPIPTAIDAVISPEDALLLEYAYSRNRSEMGRFIKCAAAVYGATIQCLSLRHALLAWIAAYLPPAEFGERLENNKQLARRMLINKLATPSHIDDVDVFASWALLRLATSTFARDLEVSILLEGTRSMVRHLSDNSNKGWQSDIIRVFGSFIYHNLNEIGTLISLNRLSTTPRELPTFEERFKYYEQLRHDGTHSDWRLTTRTEVTGAIMGYLIQIALLCLREIAMRDIQNDPSYTSISQLRGRHSRELCIAAGDVYTERFGFAPVSFGHGAITNYTTSGGRNT